MGALFVAMAGWIPPTSGSCPPEVRLRTEIRDALNIRCCVVVYYTQYHGSNYPARKCTTKQFSIEVEVTCAAVRFIYRYNFFLSPWCPPCCRFYVANGDLWVLAAIQLLLYRRVQVRSLVAFTKRHGLLIIFSASLSSNCWATARIASDDDVGEIRVMIIDSTRVGCAWCDV